MTKYLTLADSLRSRRLRPRESLAAHRRTFALHRFSRRTMRPSQSGIVTVSGKAARAAQLTLDGAPLLHEEDGNFSTTLTFPRGGSVLTFAATDLFGKRVTATRTIFVP